MSTSENLKVGDILTREEISHLFGGSMEKYLPHVGGDVVCGCFDPLKNPNAPEEILVGLGTDRVKYAKRLVEQKVFVPVFLKRASKKYEFVGNFRAKNYSDDSNEVAQKAKFVDEPDKIAGVLYLEKKEES